MRLNVSKPIIQDAMLVTWVISSRLFSLHWYKSPGNSPSNVNLYNQSTCFFSPFYSLLQHL